MFRFTHNYGYDYLFARLHGMWGKAAQGEFLLSLARSATEENFFKALDSHGLAYRKIENFQLAMRMRELDICHSIRSQVSEGLAEYLNAIIDDLACESIKAVLNFRFFPERETDIHDFLVDMEYADGFPDVRALLGVKGTENFIQALPSRKRRKKIAPLIRKLASDLDLPSAECALDDIDYQSRIESAKGLPAPVRDVAISLVRFEIDTMNIMLILRSIGFYEFTPERMQQIWLHNGTLSNNHLLELLRLKNLPSIINALPERFAKVLRQFQNSELHTIENSFSRVIWHQAHTIFRDANQPLMAIVAFPYLLRYETMNLSRIHEGIRFGLPADSIIAMLIGDF